VTQADTRSSTRWPAIENKRGSSTGALTHSARASALGARRPCRAGAGGRHGSPRARRLLGGDAQSDHGDNSARAETDDGEAARRDPGRTTGDDSLETAEDAVAAWAGLFRRPPTGPGGAGRHVAPGARQPSAGGGPGDGSRKRARYSGGAGHQARGEPAVHRWAEQVLPGRGLAQFRATTFRGPATRRWRQDPGRPSAGLSDRLPRSGRVARPIFQQAFSHHSAPSRKRTTQPGRDASSNMGCCCSVPGNENAAGRTRALHEGPWDISGPETAYESATWHAITGRSRRWIQEKNAIRRA